MKLLKLKLLVFALIVFAAGSAFASYSYEVTVNTSSVSGDSGLIYMNYFNAGGSTSTATVSGFTADATTSLGLQDTGDVMNGAQVVGTLPSNVAFTSTRSASNPNNDYLQAITLGSSTSFLVSFSGPATTATTNPSAASTFSLGFITDTGSWNNIFPPTVSGSNGELFDITLNDGGATFTTTYGGPVTLAQTPIPPSALLFGSSLIGLIGVRRRLKN